MNELVDIIIILILLLFNGFFAMCEIALVSSKKARLENAAVQGSKGAKIALKLLAEPEKFLSTVQIGITLVGIIAGAYGAGAFTKNLQPYIEKISFLNPIAEEVSFTLIIIVITYFSLIIGELVPKTIALNNPEKITTTFAPIMRGLSIVTYPLVSFLSLSTKLFLKLLFIKRKKEPVVTEEELKYMIETGSQHGVIEKSESQIMHGVFKFGDKKASDVMTAREDILFVDLTESKAQIQSQIFDSSYTKFPLCAGSIDKIVGVASVTNILKYVTGDNFDIKKYWNEPVFYPDNMAALSILENFKAIKTHMGFVVDEHGKTLGLITLHDLVENIMGDLPEIDKIGDTEILFRHDGSWLVDGAISLEKLSWRLKFDFRHIISTHNNLEEFCVYQLQADVRTGAFFTFGNYRFEIVDMDGLVIDKVLISKH